ncbi:MAG: hypothetical protein LBM87_01085 [Ruminococcus sp.]|jgi:hypothetical protein|nr:hypothetical protein [Ruminococcus sp.]
MDRRKVYLLKFPNDEDFTAIACDCQLWDKQDFKGLCYLTPPDRGHMIPGELISENENGFIFHSDGYEKGDWNLRELTIEDIKFNYQKIVGGGNMLSKTINNTEELHQWFRSEFHFGEK